MCSCATASGHAPGYVREYIANFYGRFIPFYAQRNILRFKTVLCVYVYLCKFAIKSQIRANKQRKQHQKSNRENHHKNTEKVYIWDVQFFCIGWDVLFWLTANFTQGRSRNFHRISVIPGRTKKIDFKSDINFCVLYFEKRSVYYEIRICKSINSGTK